MSQRMLSHKSSYSSLKVGAGRPPDRVGTPSSKKEVSSDESELSIPYHRPRCPWGRRQSYVQRVNRDHFDYSLGCLSGNRRNIQPKRPWIVGQNKVKTNDIWKRPWGNKILDVNCFCHRIEQAKGRPPSRKESNANWIESRRNQIVNKFDGFSKGILKLTGKLSQVTIAMVTAKIKENLEKKSEPSLIKLCTSSVKISKDNACPKMNDGDRVASSNCLPETTCVQMALIPSDYNIFNTQARAGGEKSRPSIRLSSKKKKNINSHSVKFQTNIGIEKSSVSFRRHSPASDSCRSESALVKRCRSLKRLPTQTCESDLVRAEEEKAPIDDVLGFSKSFNTDTKPNGEEFEDDLCSTRTTSIDESQLSEDRSITNQIKLPQPRLKLSSPRSQEAKSLSVRDKLVSFGDQLRLFDEDSMNKIATLKDDNQVDEIQELSDKSVLLCDQTALNDIKNDKRLDNSVCTLKSAMHLARSTHSLAPKKRITFDTDKSCKFSGKRKLFGERNSKRMLHPSIIECTGGGYSVQLVKFKNFERKEKKHLGLRK